MNRLPPLIGVALCAVALGALPSAAQNRAGSVGSGGALALQARTRLHFTLGQAVIGDAGASHLNAWLGFWHPNAAAKSTVNVTNSARPTLIAIPTPSSRSTALRFTIPSSGHVEIDLYDALGQPVRTLVEGSYDAGSTTIGVDLDDLATGSYTAALRFGAERISTPLMLIE